MKTPWGPADSSPPAEDEWDDSYRPHRRSVPPAPRTQPETEEAARLPRTFSVSRSSPSQAPPPQRGPDSEPPSSNFAGEDFLFHLYRGSELLQDNCVAEAKEELERALSMRPRDVEGQSLLGVVYFRLGLYPRAIEIYEELIQAFPAEVTPRVNLALCYVKTGQHQQARELLEDVIRRVPDHKRAWGYLGLIFERLNDFPKALAAYERAGQDHMARRMGQRLEGGPPPGEVLAGSGPDELRDVAADAMQELDASTRAFVHADSRASPGSPGTGRWTAVEPGREGAGPRSKRAPGPAASTPERLIEVAADVPPASPLSAPTSGRGALSPTALAERAKIRLPNGGVSPLSDSLVLVRVEDGFLVRLASVRALLPDGPPFSHSPAYRRSRGQSVDEPLGGAAASLGLIQGKGTIAVAASDGQRLLSMVVDGDSVYVKEPLLVGFDGALRYERGRLPAGDGHQPVIQLSGRGALMLECRGTLRTIQLAADRTAVVESARVLGWTGRLLSQVARPEEGPGCAQGFVVFSGEGSIFVELE